MVVKAIAGVIGISVLAGILLTFKDDISSKLSPEMQDTPEEIEQQKKQNERGALENTQAFFFGEESLEPSKVPPQLGEKTAIQQKIDERGAVANTFSFLFGEGSLREDERLPTEPTEKFLTESIIGNETIPISIQVESDIPQTDTLIETPATSGKKSRKSRNTRGSENRERNTVRIQEIEAGLSVG